MNAPFSPARQLVLEERPAPSPAGESAFSARERLWVMALGALLALAFCAYYLKHTWVMNEADPRLLAQFKGNRPYQLRILMPLLVHWGTQFTGLDVARCYQLLLIGFCLAFFRVFTVYLGHFCAPRAANWLGLFLVWPLFALYSHKWFYLYDVPAAFFATLALLLLVQRRFALYLLVFGLATLNRETSAFLTLAFALALWDVLPRRRFVALVAAQVGIWLVLRALLSHLFAANPGKPIEWHIADNLSAMAGLFRAPIPLALGSALVTLFTLWMMGIATRRAQPEFLRRARGVFWPFLALMSGVGVLTETRLYSELIPILLAPALIGTFNLIAAPSSSFSASPSSL